MPCLASNTRPLPWDTLSLAECVEEGKMVWTGDLAGGERQLLGCNSSALHVRRAAGGVCVGGGGGALL